MCKTDEILTKSGKSQRISRRENNCWDDNGNIEHRDLYEYTVEVTKLSYLLEIMFTQTLTIDISRLKYVLDYLYQEFPTIWLSSYFLLDGEDMEIINRIFGRYG